jgi:hypothetical protein
MQGIRKMATPCFAIILTKGATMSAISMLATRMTIPLLFVFAFCHSLGKKRRAPLESNSFTHPGWRSRLALATLVFSTLWSARAAAPKAAQEPSKTKNSKRPARPTCYKSAALPPPEQPTPTTSFLQTLRNAWVVLDPNKGEAFRQKVEEGIKNGQFTHSIGDLLTLAYNEIAYHKARTSSKGTPVTCYSMTPLGSVQFEARGSALKQVELLRKASKEGKLDEVTVQKVKRTLAKDLDLLKEANNRSTSGQLGKGEDLLQDLHSDGSATSQALDAATIIVEMEKGQSSSGS